MALLNMLLVLVSTYLIVGFFFAVIVLYGYVTKKPPKNMDVSIMEEKRKPSTFVYIFFTVLFKWFTFVSVELDR